MTEVKLKIPPKLHQVFTGEASYRGAYGPRGSGKTYSFAKMTAVKGYEFWRAGRDGIILCGREFMNSLDDSSLEEIKKAIRSEPWLEEFYEIGEKYIRSKDGRIKYAFAGLRHNIDSIKSKSNILLCWIDEAEHVSEAAWSKLLPTIREDGSECWLTWNPEIDGSPTDKRFRKNKPTNSKIIELGWRDNPWFTQRLEEERLNDLRRDPDLYQHVWEGAYLTRSNAQIFAGKYSVEDFDPGQDWDGPYCGMDFGFAQDPTSATMSYIHNKTLYIRHECGKIGLELDDTSDYMSRYMPELKKYALRADSARPESISYLRRHGLPNIAGVKKWPGSIEDGIQHLRSYDRIIIHPSCEETAKEFRLYSYKVDRLSGDVLPSIVDAHNHYIDSIRYALQPMIKQKNAPRVRVL